MHAMRSIAVFVIAVKLGILWLAGQQYGYMSDELYFLDAARHLAAGYVDYPPLIAWLAAALQAGGLDSVVALRSCATLIGIGVTLFGVDLVRVIGGGAFSRWLTALVLLFAPGFLSVQSMFTMNALDQLWWVAAFWLTAQYLRTEQPRWLLWLGLVIGLGVLTKLSILALAAALPLAFLVWDRRVFICPSAWLGAAVAVLVAAPFLVWQWANNWPFLDFISAYNSTPPKALVLQNPVLGMLLTMNPAYALIWGPGAISLLLANDRAQRVLGTAAWLCLALFVLAGVKFYFAVPVFALFTVGGALLWERWSRGGWQRSLRIALLVTALSGLMSVPMAAPVLAPERLQQVADFLRDGEQGLPGEQPAELERYFPHFAEMRGWPELVSLVSEVWTGLEPRQRNGTILFGSFYGHSAALNQLDAANVLPPAYGRHMSYHLWSRDLVYRQALFVGFESGELEALFGVVELRGRLQCEGCMSREQGLAVHYVADPLLPLDEIRVRLKRYDFF